MKAHVHRWDVFVHVVTCLLMALMGALTYASIEADGWFVLVPAVMLSALVVVPAIPLRGCDCA